MATHCYTDLKVSARSTAEGGHVAYGVEIDGAFMPFYFMPTGGFEDDLATAALDSGKFAGLPLEGAPAPTPGEGD